MISLYTGTEEKGLIYVRELDSRLRAMPAMVRMSDVSSERTKFTFWHEGNTYVPTVGHSYFPDLRWYFQPSVANQAKELINSSGTSVVGPMLVANMASIMLTPADADSPYVAALGPTYRNCLWDGTYLYPLVGGTADAYAYKAVAHSYSWRVRSDGIYVDLSSSSYYSGRWTELGYFAWFLLWGKGLNTWDSSAIEVKVTGSSSSSEINNWAGKPTEVRKYLEDGSGAAYYLVLMRNGRNATALNGSGSYGTYAYNLSGFTLPRLKVPLSSVGEIIVTSWGFEAWPTRMINSI